MKNAKDLASSPGRTLAGRYAYRRDLGRGGSGRVILVADLRAGGAFRAAKVVERDQTAALVLEFERLRSVSHPLVARVHEILRIDESSPAPFSIRADSTVLIEDYAEGRSASEAAPTISASERVVWSLGVAYGAARGLAAIHAAGLVHGDVKPSNLIVRESAEPGELPTVTVIDLGLAERPGVGGPMLRGTPEFLAPEAWFGERGFAIDIYGLGATLHSLLTGAKPGVTSQGDGHTATPLVRKADDLPSIVPESVRRFVTELLAATPDERPDSARNVAADAAALLHGLGADVELPAGLDDRPSSAELAARTLGLPLVGRERLVTDLAAAISRGGVVQVRGAAGAGRSRLIREAVGFVQRKKVERNEPVPTYVSPEQDPSDIETRGAVLLHVLDGRDSRAVVRSSAIEPERVVVIETREAVVLGEAREVIDVPPLGTSALVELLGLALDRPPSPDWVSAATRTSAGLPGRLCRLVAEVQRTDGDRGRPERLLALASNPDGDETDPLSHGSTLAAWLSLAGGALPAEALRRVIADLDDQVEKLRFAGSISSPAPGELRLRDDLISWEDPTGPAPDSKTIRQVTRALPSKSQAEPFLLAAIGSYDKAAEKAAGLGRTMRFAGCPEKQADYLERLARRLPDSHAASLTTDRADALRACGRYLDALQVLDEFPTEADLPLRVEIERLAGNLPNARTAARRASEDCEPTLRFSILAVLARVAFDAGDFSEATLLAEEVLASSDATPSARGRALEVEALTAWSAGRLDVAEAAAARAFGVATTTDDRAALARSRSLQASIALAASRPIEARRLFAEALSHGEAVGEHVATAADLANLGAARKSEGDLGPAIALLKTAARRYAELDSPYLATTLLNLASAALCAGDTDVARSALRAGKDMADRVRPDRGVATYLGVVGLDLAVREDGPTVARRLADQLVDSSVDVDPELRAVVFSRHAEAATLTHDLATADRDIARGLKLAKKARSSLALAEIAVAHVRVLIAKHKGVDALKQAQRAVTLSDAVGFFEVRLRAYLAAADAAASAGSIADLHNMRSQARVLLDRAAAGLSPLGRSRLRRVPAYRDALAAPSVEPDSAQPTTPSSERVDERWRRLATVARQLTGERRLPRLRESLVDIAVDLLGAERGLFLERNVDAEWTVRVGKRIDGVVINPDGGGFSRSIAARALDEGQPIRTVDAAADERLRDLDSIHALALRSIVVAPVPDGPQRPGAVLYLEDRLRPGAFAPDDLALLADLAQLGAIALDSTLAFRAERKQRRRLSVLKRTLQRTVEAQALEIVAARRVLGDTELFNGIVAVSAAMRKALDLAIRVAPSDLPVLITGESGTGKELMARAVHAHSRRSNARFVAESCSAIPDGLLESALFGHVKGAFTGAERPRVGLFEAADGGTLLLDEIGEMSGAMQSRLLRAVQEREVRPVGSDRTKPVDVRFIAATHRDLESMVASGDFREDLFYRLAVVVVRVPPLRERPEDIEPLVKHFLGRFAGDQRILVERNVIDRLAQFPWPGNVRQLENEVQRALVLAEDVIRLDHLSPSVRGDMTSEDNVVVEPAPYDLKGQVARLERRLIERALDRCERNQTKAAKMLGVSRYGLQKMIKRLGVR